MNKENKYMTAEMFFKSYKQLEKELKALEIIKSLPQEEKEILLNAIYTHTKSEDNYDLLKEVLL